ncbi:hypothetical protein GJAV_G00015780 [Gymnothorax javanicus]|nr:hypothetical protein GJAV_G00015780 [Gymnothorax javanicus]
MVMLHPVTVTFNILFLLASLFDTVSSSGVGGIKSSLVRDELDGVAANIKTFINFGSHTNLKSISNSGFEPGDVAPAFQVKTLNGEFVYPPPSGVNVSLVIHAFTNNSAFLECLWTSEAALTDLVQHLPESCHVLFLTFDDAAARDALWMQEQIQRVAVHRKDVLSRLHISPIPVHALGNWIPRVLYSWGCTGHNCGLAQVVFSSSEWDMPVVAKRLDARYDWLMGRWDQRSYSLIDAGDGCQPHASVSAAVAWVSEGNCSFFTKVQNMAKSKAVGVLVYASPGSPIQDMNCVGEECDIPLSIPASMVHLEPSVVLALLKMQPVNVSFQTTPSPSFFFGIDQQGALAEVGWFLYPTFRFLCWQAQWFDYSRQLQEQLRSPSEVLTVFDNAVLQGEGGAVATVNLPPDLMKFDVLKLDAALSCPGRRDETCAHWDHTVYLFVCCDHFSPLCNMELGRWITAFRRGTGHWLTDVSPLLPLLNNERCTFTMKTVPWAMPWVTSLNLRFSSSNHSGQYSDRLYPFKLMSLFNGGTFDKNYNKRYQLINFTVPPSAKKVEIYAVITGHGSDENGCGEFCVTSHHFLVNGTFNNSLVFDSAGTALGCAAQAEKGAVPNEHGTWLYGRGGWCDGLQVNPWRVDISDQLYMDGPNTILYFGLYEGRDPNPTSNPGYIVIFSILRTNFEINSSRLISRDKLKTDKNNKHLPVTDALQPTDDPVKHHMSKVRILCWVMTAPKHLQKRTKHVRATWTKRCDKVLFMSSEETDFPTVGLNVSEGRDQLYWKTIKAFQYIYKNHLGDADWFLKTDDDTYVVLDNLRYLLSQYDTGKPIYFGRRFRPFVAQGYMSGGAGYVLSKEALRRFVQGFHEGKCTHFSSIEDMALGKCMEAMKVEAGDSRDKIKRETFHPFDPERHLIPAPGTKRSWYWGYGYYPAINGPECCSDFAVSFHYIRPSHMYVLEYFAYHLHPYGYQYRFNPDSPQKHIEKITTLNTNSYT